MSLQYITIPSSHIPLGAPNGRLLSGIPIKSYMQFSSFPCMLHSHSPTFLVFISVTTFHEDYIQIIKFLVTKFYGFFLSLPPF